VVTPTSHGIAWSLAAISAGVAPSRAKNLSAGATSFVLRGVATTHLWTGTERVPVPGDSYAGVNVKDWMTTWAPSPCAGACPALSQKFMSARAGPSGGLLGPV
jgi:hypothetical protein